MQDNPTPAAAATPDNAEIGARNRLVITILLVSAFVVILNETVMSVALPRLMADLGVTAAAAQWLTTAFMLTMAIVIPVTGFLLQRMNTRPVFMLAMTLFSAGTVICAVSPSLAPLIFGRVVQACGTAIMLPLLMTTVMNLVPPAARGKTMGNISIVISVAPAIGPTISGLILAYLSWRWMFILVLPIALLALLIGGRLMKNVTEPRYAPLDVLSVILSAFGFGGLVYGLSNMGVPGAADAPVPAWMALVIGLVTLVAFLLRQIKLQRKDDALLDLRTFTHRNFTICVSMMGIFMMALFGIIILLPIYLQDILGVSTLNTGLLLLPGGLIMGLLAPFVGRLYDRWGPRRLLVPGSMLASGVLWALTLIGEHTSVYAILAGHIIMSFGLAMIFTPLFTASLSSVPARLYSHASAIVGTVQQVAGAAGVALFVALMSARAAALTAEGVTQSAATTDGMRVAFFWGAAISILAVAAAFFVNKPEDEVMPQAPAVGEHLPAH